MLILMESLQLTSGIFLLCNSVHTFFFIFVTYDYAITSQIPESTTMSEAVYYGILQFCNFLNKTLSYYMCTCV